MHYEHLDIYDDSDDISPLIGHLDHNPHPNSVLDQGDDPRLVPQMMEFRPYRVDEAGPAPSLQWENYMPVMHVPMVIRKEVADTLDLRALYDKITSES